MFKLLFTDWDLGTWADILQVVGFGFAFASFVISLFIKSEINKLKTNYIFDKRIKKHILNLKNSSSEINQLLNDYNDNKLSIKTEFSKCVAELEDLIPKVSFWQSIRSRRLICFLKARKKRQFADKTIQVSTFIFYISKYPKRIYETSYDDIWVAYNGLIEIIRQLENIKLNKDKSL